MTPRRLIITGVSWCLFLSLFFWAATEIQAADCTDVAPGGNLTLTTACAFPGTVNGVDSGTGTTNTATLTLESGSTLTIGALQELAMGSVVSLYGGSIVIIDGGSFHPGTPLWMTDADADGVPDSTEQILSSTQPASAARRYIMTDVTIADSNSSQSCPTGSNAIGSCNYCNSGAVALQNDGSDVFGECQTFYACNGSGSCTRHAKRVFISSSTSKGNLNGITGADSSCQLLANNASLGGTWKAWLSSNTESAASRMTHAALPYILTDELTKIADNWTGLTGGTLQASINKTETAATVSQGSTAWTNTNADGTLYSSSNLYTCTNWSNNGGSGLFGTNNKITSGAWTADASDECKNPRSLYCVEQ